jgi:hypothetical protein
MSKKEKKEESRTKHCKIGFEFPPSESITFWKETWFQKKKNRRLYIVAVNESPFHFGPTPEPLFLTAKTKVGRHDILIFLFGRVNRRRRRCRRSPFFPLTLCSIDRVNTQTDRYGRL